MKLVKLLGILVVCGLFQTAWAADCQVSLSWDGMDSAGNTEQSLPVTKTSSWSWRSSTSRLPDPEEVRKAVLVLLSSKDSVLYFESVFGAYSDEAEQARDKLTAALNDLLRLMGVE